MQTNQFFKKDLVVTGGEFASKEAVLRFFANFLVQKNYAKNAQIVYEKALQRENEISTGIGNKIAIPHIRDQVMNQSVILFANIEPVNWKSLDDIPVEKIFFIAMSDKDGQKSHLDVIAHLSRLLMQPQFVSDLNEVKNYDDLIRVVNKNDKLLDNNQNNEGNLSMYDIVAVTACPTGIAHTFMAAQKIEDAAKKLGIKIKVETQGTDGSKNVLTQQEINNAKGVIIAADRVIETGRFAGHTNVLEMDTSAVIKNAEKQILRSLKNEGIKFEGVKNNSQTLTEPTDLISFNKFGKRLYKSLMTGVSYMLPFVIFGGILIALSFLIDINNSGESNYGSINSVAKWFNSLGNLAFGMMVPILCAYIAHAIVGRFGLLPGFVCGLISTGSFLFALNPSTGEVSWLKTTSEVDGAASSGFFGAVIGGILTGAVLIALIKYIFSYLPQSLNGIKNILFIPLFGTLIVVTLFWVVNIPFIYLNYGFSELLTLIGDHNLNILLGLILGTMMAIDLGGPINKAAYVFGTASLTAAVNNGDGTVAMAAAMAGGMVPPLGIALSCTFFKKMWTVEERQAGYTNYVMGLCFITEGAIPFTAEKPKLLVPANLLGGFVAGLLTAAFGITLNAPHGGIFIFALVKSSLNSGWSTGTQIGAGVALYLIAIIVGSLVSMLTLYILHRIYSRKTPNQIQNKSEMNPYFKKIAKIFSRKGSVKSVKFDQSGNTNVKNATINYYHWIPKKVV